MGLTEPAVLVAEAAVQLVLEAAEVVRSGVVEAEAHVDEEGPEVVEVEACRETSEAAVQNIGHLLLRTLQLAAVEQEASMGA
jgi:predicted ribosome-associated RNA-binding protein Tma20